MAYSSDKAAETVQISTVARKKSWADLDLSLVPHAITKDIMPLKDDRAIKNAVRNLILTKSTLMNGVRILFYRTGITTISTKKK